MTEFEKRLRAHIEERVSGRADEKADFSKVDATKLALIDLNTVDESVLVGNIVRVVENVCHEELVTLNRGIGHLLGKPHLEASDESARARDDRHRVRRGARHAARRKAARNSRS